MFYLRKSSDNNLEIFLAGEDFLSGLEFAPAPHADKLRLIEKEVIVVDGKFVCCQGINVGHRGKEAKSEITMLSLYYYSVDYPIIKKSDLSKEKTTRSILRLE